MGFINKTPNNDVLNLALSRTLVLVILAAMGLTAAPALAQDADADSAVRLAFGQVSAALVAKDGEAIATLSSVSSRNYFGGLALSAVRDDRETLYRLPMADRLFVLGLRHYVDAATLPGLDGTAALTELIAVSGLLGPMDPALPGPETVSIDVDGDEALVDAGGLSLHFVNEDGSWHIDVAQLASHLADVHGQLANQAGLSAEAYYLAVLEQLSGRAVADDIWTPSQPRVED